MARRLGRGWTHAHEAARLAFYRDKGKRDGGKVEVAALIEGGGDVNAQDPVRARRRACGDPPCMPHTCPRPRAAACISSTRVTVCAPPRRATHTGGAYLPRARRAPACPLASLVPARARRCTYLVYTCDRLCATTTGDTHRRCVSHVRAAPPRARLSHSCPRPRAAACISYARVIVCAPPRRATHTGRAYRPCPRASRPRVSACLTRARARAPLHVSRLHV